MRKYSREHPSDKYRELLGYYADMHEQGYELSKGESGESRHQSAEKAYPGHQLPFFKQPIKQMIDLHHAKTLIDYGSGKGQQYGPLEVTDSNGKVYPDIKTYWQVNDIHCYDPGVKAFSELPTQQFDGLVSTDVMEHCSPADVPWIVREMFSLVHKFLFVNICCEPAYAVLPSGENAHIMLRSPHWWHGFFTGIAEDYPDVDFLLCCTQRDPAITHKNVVKPVWFHRTK